MVCVSFNCVNLWTCQNFEGYINCYSEMPTNRCQYNGCLTNKSSGISMHRFPKDVERCKLWVEACNNPKLLDVSPELLYKKSLLCNKHFADWCFMNSDKVKLTPYAIPDREEPSMLKPGPKLNTNVDSCGLRFFYK